MEIDPHEDSLRFNAVETRILPLLEEKVLWPVSEADGIYAYAERQRKLLRKGLARLVWLEADEYRAGISDYNTICRLQSLLSPYLHSEADPS